MDIRDKINHAYEQRQYINHYIMLSDTKMAIFVALNATLLSNVISKFECSNILFVFIQVFSIILLIMAVILSFSVLIPRTYNINDKAYIDDAKHIYNINNYEIQWCSILPIFFKEAVNLFKAIFFIKEKRKQDEQSEDTYPNFATSWVSMYQSKEISLSIPENMEEKVLLEKLNVLNDIVAGICATKNALAKISIILSIYAYFLILVYNIII